MEVRPGAHAYRPDIDGLRAIAVLCVLVFHAFPSRLPGGFVGVDVFFVISGYLITGIVAREVEAGTFTLGRFYARRVRRIFPALALVLTAALAAACVLLVPDDFLALARHTVSGVLFTANLHLWSEAGYFDGAAEEKPLLHLWSLGVEEQFYFFWPVLLAFTARRARAVAATVALASLALCVVLVHAYPVATFYAPFTRLWELLVGALLALFEARDPARTTTPHTRAAAAGVSLLGVAAILGAARGFHADLPFPGAWALVPVLGTALVIRSGMASALNRLVLGHPLLVGIGLVSNPLYLWHWPLLTFFRLVTDERGSIATRLALLGAALALSVLTYRLVEKPMRRAPERARVVAGLGGALALPLALAIAVVAADGFPDRPGMRRWAEVRRQVAWPWWSSPACEARWPFAGRGAWWFCVVSSERPPTVVLLGDSHANHLYPGLAHEPALGRQTVLSIGTCAPVDGLRMTSLKTGENPCANMLTQQQTAFLDGVIAREPHVSHALLAARWPDFDSQGRQLDPETGAVTAPMFEAIVAAERTSSPRDQYAAALERRVATLEKRRIVPILVLDSLILPFDVKACVPGPFRATPAPCAFPRTEVERRQEGFRRVARELAGRHPSLRVFDPLDGLCGPTTCAAVDGERLLLRDAHHLSANGSTRVAARLAAWARTEAPALVEAR